MCSPKDLWNELRSIPPLLYVSYLALGSACVAITIGEPSDIIPDWWVRWPVIIGVLLLALLLMGIWRKEPQHQTGEFPWRVLYSFVSWLVVLGLLNLVVSPDNQPDGPRNLVYAIGVLAVIWNPRWISLLVVGVRSNAERVLLRCVFTLAFAASFFLAHDPNQWPQLAWWSGAVALTVVAEFLVCGLCFARSAGLNASQAMDRE